MNNPHQRSDDPLLKVNLSNLITVTATGLLLWSLQQQITSNNLVVVLTEKVNYTVDRIIKIETTQKEYEARIRILELKK